MKNKGFTLIELLAVIVILAIIALIATPIILSIIGNTKESANKRSVENYVAAVNNAMAAKQLGNNAEITPGTYVTKDGKTLTKVDDSSSVITVDYDGPALEAIITITDKFGIKYSIISIDDVKLDKTYSSSGNTVVLGDLNSDGVINLDDKKVFAMLMNNPSNYSDEVKKAADLNGDGKYDLNDAVILGYMTGSTCYLSDTAISYYMPTMPIVGSKITCRVSDNQSRDFYLLTSGSSYKLILSNEYDAEAVTYCSNPSTCTEPDTLNAKLSDAKSKWSNVSNYLSIPTISEFKSAMVTFPQGDKNPLKGTAFWLVGDNNTSAIYASTLLEGAPKGQGNVYFRPLITIPSSEVSW